jgi:hypothetical protein
MNMSSEVEVDVVIEQHEMKYIYISIVFLGNHNNYDLCHPSGSIEYSHFGPAMGLLRDLG